MELKQVKGHRLVETNIVLKRTGNWMKVLVTELILV